MQSSFGKNANAGKYFHEQELLFFLQFDFPYTRCFYSECVRRKTLLFYLFFHQYNYMYSRRILVSEITHWKDSGCIHFLQQV